MILYKGGTKMGSTQNFVYYGIRMGPTSILIGLIYNLEMLNLSY